MKVNFLIKIHNENKNRFLAFHFILAIHFSCFTINILDYRSFSSMSGVPQGYNLGPLPIIFYINYLLSSLSFLISSAFVYENY